MGIDSFVLTISFCFRIAYIANLPKPFVCWQFHMGCLRHVSVVPKDSYKILKDHL